MPKVAPSNDALRRKFSAVTNTQVSITSLSTWILQNKRNGEAIAGAWSNQLKKSDHEHRLTLFYLANDVVQNCRKKAPELKDIWRDTMVSAFENLTHHSIRSGVEKVLSVWETRQVFDKDAVEKMRTIIATAKSTHKDKAERALKEFRPNDLIEALKEFASCENDLQRKKELLSSSGLDESDPEKLLDKVKERGQGQRARQELEQWTQLLIEYVDIQETAIERRRKLLSLLDQSCIFYKRQFIEVNVVLKAYKDYQERVLAQKRRCQEMMKTRFPENFPNISPMPSVSNSPVPSPAADMELSEAASSSDEEQMPSSLASFFAPADSNEPPAHRNSLSKGEVAADGDLDSRLANILGSSGTSGTPTGYMNPESQPEPKRERKSRWDSEPPQDTNGDIPQPPLPPGPAPADEWVPPSNNHQPWEDQPPSQFRARGPPPQNFSPRFQMQPRFQNSDNFSPRFQNENFNHRGRGRGGGRGHFSPRTPQGSRPPRPNFNSEGSNFRGRGGPRGMRGGFTPRGPRPMMRGRFPHR